MSQFGKAPPGYVPGVGRGAVGFTTRSDVGSGGTNAEVALAGVQGRGRGVAASSGMQALRKLGGGTAPGAGAAGAVAPAVSSGEGSYDEFAGYTDRLFGDTPYDEDDREADRVYAAVEDRMEQRTKRSREAREAEEAQRAKLTQARIADGFADLKPQLSALRVEDWDAIPEIGDRSLRYKQRRADTGAAAPVPDNIVELGRSGGSSALSLAAGGGAARGAGSASSASSASSAGDAGAADIVGLQRGRTQMLSLRLDRMGDSVCGQTTVDPTGYLTSLGAAGGSGLSDASDLEDVKRARLLMRSVVTTNPRHGPGWIALARLEEQVRLLSEARRVIRTGCEMCPGDEDVWLEAARLQTPPNARIALADGVRHLPTSVRLWQAAAELETTPEARQAVLRKVRWVWWVGWRVWAG